LGDVFASGFGGKANRKNACLLFNILHREESVHLLAEAARVERPRGSVLVIHPGTTDLQAEKLPPSAFASFRWPTGSGKTTQSQLTLTDLLQCLLVFDQFPARLRFKTQSCSANKSVLFP
jgi:hypothetical protein